MWVDCGEGKGGRWETDDARGAERVVCRVPLFLSYLASPIVKMYTGGLGAGDRQGAYRVRVTEETEREI